MTVANEEAVFGCQGSKAEVKPMDSKVVLEKGGITRRRFCNRVLLASSALALGASSLKVAGAAQRESELAYPPMKIAGAESLLPGAFLYFSYPTTRDSAVLLRAQDGQYSAFSRKCAHRGCSVDFNAARQCLTCPCHQGAYEARTGMVIFGPPPRPLDPIVLQMQAGGQVWAVGKGIGKNSPNA